jgi:hypothetical protein
MRLFLSVAKHSLDTPGSTARPTRPLYGLSAIGMHWRVISTSMGTPGEETLSKSDGVEDDEDAVVSITEWNEDILTAASYDRMEALVKAIKMECSSAHDQLDDSDATSRTS